MPLTNATSATQRSGRTRLYPEDRTRPDTQPLTLTHLRPREGTSQRPQWLVDTGPKRLRNRMVEFPADRSQVTFGSAASCSHRIRHHSIAEMHAALVRTPNRGVYLVDLTGGNGTFVNEEPVVDRVLLMDRDRIRLGSGVEYEYVDGTLPRESRVRQWVRRMTFTASKTGW